MDRFYLLIRALAALIIAFIIPEIDLHSPQSAA